MDSRPRIYPWQRRKHVEGLWKEIEGRLENDFLTADHFYATIAAGFIRQGKFEKRRTAYVRDWCLKHGTLAVSDEQAAAIGAVNGNIQVVARAGSGKTATVINRAYFLHKHCRVPLEAMILLAFNRSAAREVEERLFKLCGIRPPHVMTFHALAYAIVHPEENLLGGAIGQGEDEQAFIIDQLLTKMLEEESFANKVAETMIAFLQNEEEDISIAVEDDGEQEKTEVRPPRSTLNNDYVKSLGEQRIANFLYLHQVEYKYEKSYWWDGINYRPDFTVLLDNGTQVIVEYFGLKGNSDYDAMSQEKREYWRRQSDYVFLEYEPADMRQLDADGHPKKLREDLLRLGATLDPRDMTQVWEEVKPRALPTFRMAASSYISRVRKLGLSVEDVTKLCQSSMPTSRAEALFLSLVPTIYEGYLAELEVREKEDFDGLLSRAVAKIEEGHTVFLRKSGGGDLRDVRFLFIDEFQDFSLLFDRLVAAIQSASPEMRVFCVGDDWQAINGFAGSDLSYFADFKRRYADSKVLHITTNYRSTKEIVEAGNILMKGKGKPAVANKASGGSVAFCDLEKLSLTPIEQNAYPGDQITPATIRLTAKIIAGGKDVVLLARRNGLPWFMSDFVKPKRNESQLEAFLRVIQSIFPEEDAARISVSTAHKYKGLQKTSVIVLDAVERSYPLIHPTWIFLRSLGDSLDSLTAEEQRLLYVALTRAEVNLYIVMAKAKASPFLKRLSKQKAVLHFDWSNAPPPLTSSERLIVTVGNAEGYQGRGTYAIKDQLKADGFKWDSKTKTWNSSMEVADFHSGALATRPWWNEAEGVTATIMRSDLSVVGQYALVNGQEVGE